MQNPNKNYADYEIFVNNMKPQSEQAPQEDPQEAEEAEEPEEIETPAE
jgi:hypothetical protein